MIDHYESLTPLEQERYRADRMKHFVPADEAAGIRPPPVYTNPADVLSGSSWAPVNIAAAVAAGLVSQEPTICARTDGVHLIYAGEINAVVAEPESGKTWLVLLAAKQVLDSGGKVLYLDFEGTANSILTRLRDMGVDLDELVASGRFLYVRPDEALATNGGTHELREQFAAMVGAFAPNLAVIDGVAEAMAGNGLDENSNSDAVAFCILLPRLLQMTGAAVVTVDHVTKASDSRGYARGASAKKGYTTGSQIGLEVGKPFGRGQSGEVKLIAHKDKSGYLRGEGQGKSAGTMHVVAGEDGRVTISVAPPATTFRPTTLMERVSRYLEDYPFKPLTSNAITKEAGIQGSHGDLATALRSLVAEGYVSTEPGPRNSVLHASLRPYRQAAEAVDDF